MVRFPDRSSGLLTPRAANCEDASVGDSRSTYAHIRFEVRDRVAVATLDRPEVLNALDAELRDDILRLADDVRNDDEIRALVVTGEGRGFCSGADLSRGRPGGERELSQNERLDEWGWVGRQALALHGIDKPTIAAVEGFAVGVGWSLVLACDLVISANDAFFSAPFTERGLVPDGGAAWLLVRRLGHHRAASAVLLGERLSATAAAQQGIVSRLVDPGMAEAEAVASAALLANRSGDALRLAKDLMREAPEVSFDGFLGRELLAAALAAGGPDAKEGRAAFAQGRAPRYQTGVEFTS